MEVMEGKVLPQDSDFSNLRDTCAVSLCLLSTRTLRLEDDVTVLLNKSLEKNNVLVHLSKLHDFSNLSVVLILWHICSYLRCPHRSKIYALMH